MLCEDTSVRPALGKMNTQWLRFGEHCGLRKRVLESSRLKDTIKPMNSEGYGNIGGHKDSVDHHTGSDHEPVVQRKCLNDWKVQVAIPGPNFYRQDLKATFNAYACTCFCSYRSSVDEEKYQSRRQLDGRRQMHEACNRHVARHAN